MARISTSLFFIPAFAANKVNFQRESLFEVKVGLVSVVAQAILSFSGIDANRNLDCHTEA